MSDLKEVSPIDYHKLLKVNRGDLFSPDSYLSKSVIWPLKEESLYQWRFNPKTFNGSKFADWGSLVDCLVTTPDLLDSIASFHTHADLRKKAAQEERNEAKEQGLIYAHVETLEKAKLAAANLLLHDVAAPIIKRSKKQAILLGESNGLKLKALLDFAPDDSECLYDLKTTSQWSPRELSKTIDKFGYHVQAGLYIFLWNQNYPDNPKKRFRLIWQQNEYPYEVTVTELPSGDIEAGTNWAAHQIERLAKAAKNDEWPGIFEGKTPVLGRPGYSIFNDEEELEPITPAPQKP
tara:strand:+ start:5440 stop:6315 length:876 start_codon:yes stop_codon:yes gene_type:complete